MFTLNKETDYGLIILNYFASKNEFVSLTELVKETDLPPRFIARIAAKLAKNKILKSKEGRVGGYKKTPRLEKISFYDFLKIFEGKANFLQCLNEDKNCKYTKICRHKYSLKSKLSSLITSQLKKARLADFF